MGHPLIKLHTALHKDNSQGYEQASHKKKVKVARWSTCWQTWSDSLPVLPIRQMPAGKWSEGWCCPFGWQHLPQTACWNLPQRKSSIKTQTNLKILLPIPLAAMACCSLVVHGLKHCFLEEECFHVSGWYHTLHLPTDQIVASSDRISLWMTKWQNGRLRVTLSVHASPYHLKWSMSARGCRVLLHDVLPRSSFVNLTTTPQAINHVKHSLPNTYKT